jgi:hypothetical protein
MSHRFAIFPAGAVNSVEEANDLVDAIAAGDDGIWPSEVQSLVDALPDSAEMACLAEHSADSRGVIITTTNPEDGPLRYLLRLTMASGLAVYDIELFRLYDPRGCVEIGVSLGGDDVLPYLTPALLRDLVLRPTWPSPDAPFVIVERRDQEYVQVYREEDGTYQIEYREGGPETHCWCRITDSALIADVMWAWTSQDARWRTAVAWSQSRHLEENVEDDDSWRPNGGNIRVDENSDRELGFDDTDGEPFLAYHAGNPDNDTDPEGRLVPTGWVLHVLGDEPFVTGVVDFDGVNEALTAAREYVAASAPSADEAPAPVGQTAISAAGTLENDFPVRFISDQDGVRWLTIDPSDADMTGWSVEVGPDTDWYQQRDLVAPDGERTQIDTFARDSLWGIGERWCVPVDWGERVVRWIPSGEQGSRPIDLSFRPQSYFTALTPAEELLTHVTGTARRAAVQRLIEGGRADEITDLLATAELSEDERDALGRIHPQLMGGEYLPSQDEDEVEIARIEIRSTTGDVTSVYAGREGADIHYRVVDEYGGDTLSEAAERQSITPLTLGELEEFFLSAWPLLDVLASNFDTDVEGMLDFFRADSQFYPDLDALLRQRVTAACAASESADQGDRPQPDDGPAAEEDPIRPGYGQRVFSDSAYRPGAGGTLGMGEDDHSLSVYAHYSDTEGFTLTRFDDTEWPLEDYWSRTRVAPDQIAKLRAALGAAPGQDLVQVVAQRYDDKTFPEQFGTWLEEYGVAHDMSDRWLPN